MGFGHKGPMGPRGVPGTPGADGLDGLDGNTLLNGSGAPGNGVGVNGDFYIDTTAWKIYGPKAAGVWPAGQDITGPAGPAGAGNYDWAASTAAALDAADWQDSTDFSGGHAVTFGLVESGSRKPLRLVASQLLAGQGQGIVQPVAAGADFVWAARISYSARGFANGLLAAGGYLNFQACFVNGQNLAAGGSDWYGFGFHFSNDFYPGGAHCIITGTDWDTETVGNAVTATTDEIDVIWQRSGNTLYLFVCRGGYPSQIALWNLGASVDALVGFRINTVSGAPIQWYGLVEAADTLAHVPGQE